MLMLMVIKVLVHFNHRDITLIELQVIFVFLRCLLLLFIFIFVNVIRCNVVQQVFLTVEFTVTVVEIVVAVVVVQL